MLQNKRLLSLGGGVFHLVSLAVFVLSTNTSFSQYVSIPDSTYLPNQLLIWFRPGVLNEAYLGCDADLSRTSDFPLSQDFIKDPNILALFENLGVTNMYKVVPNLNPCMDTISMARRGDTIRIPDFWNILLVEFNAETSDYDIPNLSVFLTITHQSAIKFVEPNFILHLHDGPPRISKSSTWTPNDPIPTYKPTSILGNWDPNSWQYGTDVHKAWARTKGDPDILIGIIDDGICGKAPGQTEGHYDFGNAGEVIIGGFNYDTFPLKKPTNYRAEHGTRVASIIGALSNNDLCIPGIVGGSGPSNNDHAKLIALKIADGVSTTTYGMTIPAIIEAATKTQSSPALGKWGCDFLNMSFGDEFTLQSELFRSAMAYAYANDVMIAASMGNSGGLHDYSRPKYPADIDEEWVLAVGGYHNKSRYTTSDYGAKMDILAPFENYAIDADYVTSGVPSAYYCGSAINGGVGTFSGTSSACPHALGICALLKSYWKQQLSAGVSVPPYLAPEDMTYLIAEGAVGKDTAYLPQPYYPMPRDTQKGYGIINADNTLKFLDNPYTFEHLYVGVGDFSLPTPTQGKSVFGFPGDSLNTADTLYSYEKYHIVLNNIPYGNGKTYNGIIRAWGRGSKTNGYPDIRFVYDPNNNLQPLPIYRNTTWCRVTEFHERTFNAETYLYRVLDPKTKNWVWLDGNSPNNLTFAISVLADGRLTNTDIVEVPQFTITEVYPNPVTSSMQNQVSFNYHSTPSAQLNVSIIDLLGRIVFETIAQGNEGTIRIPLINLRNGAYFITVINGNIVQTRSFVVFR